MAATVERPQAPTVAAPPRRRPAARSLAVDALRGLAVVVLIVCNNQGGAPGFWGTGHAPWHGWSFADIFFPTFLFVVGAALSFSLGDAADGGHGTLRLHLKLVRRAATLVLLGLVLHGFPFGDLGQLRLPGVLQRIGLTFLLASLVVVHLRPRAQHAFGAVVLLGSWALVALVPVPGLGRPALTPEHNLPGAVDAAVLGAGHLYKAGSYDPEGLFTTANAVVSVLAGYWTMRWLRRRPLSAATGRRLLAAGLAAMALAHVWDLALPINKRMWTGSFVLLAAGASAAMLAVAYLVLEVAGRRSLGRPLEILGLNAIVVYVGSEQLAYYLDRAGVEQWLFTSVLAPALTPRFGALAYSLLLLALWYAVARAMWRRRWFVKV